MADATASNGGPKGLEQSPPKTEGKTSFWSSSFGVTLYIIILRLPIIVMLFFLILFTNSRWWQDNQHRFGSTVFWQQALTAIVGALLAALMRDCAWMVQGAIAASWSFRKKGMALPVSEAIQDANPLLIFQTTTSLTDKAMVLLVPIFCGLLSVVYKFGITVRETTEPWDGLVRTGLLRQFMDQRNIVLNGCNDQYSACKSKSLDELYGVKAHVPDLDDYSFMDGVQVGKRISSTAYRLEAGDVPSINAAFRSKVRGGIAYKQVFIKTIVDCGRKAANPWTLDCTSVIGPERLPIRGNGTDSDLQDFRICSPYQNSQLRGLMTFYQDSLDLSCLFNASVVLRDVIATTFDFSWKVTAVGPEKPIGDNVLWANRIGLIYWGPRGLSSIIDTNAGIACYGGGSVCKGRTDAFDLEIASRLSQQMAEWIFWFLHSNKDPMPEDEELLIPFPGRKLLNYPSPWFEVVGPTSKLNMTSMQGSHLIAGANASASILRNTYVNAEYWLFCFAALTLVQIAAAGVKIYYQCHPLESVGGLVWTLRKVAPEVAHDVHGLRLSELLQYSTSLQLERNDAGAASIKKRNNIQIESNTRRTVRSSTLIYEPPAHDVAKGSRSTFLSKSFGHGDVGYAKHRDRIDESDQRDESSDVTSTVLGRKGSTDSLAEEGLADLLIPGMEDGKGSMKSTQSEPISGFLMSKRP
ncbi:hypothetical protein BC829DRAFT_432087 [Chytridium lagenaria]|nr:hypothetical protein BC829DRAFT_432087 [Chytridium lagenaria]